MSMLIANYEHYGAKRKTRKFSNLTLLVVKKLLTYFRSSTRRKPPDAFSTKNDLLTNYRSLVGGSILAIAPDDI